MATEAQWRPDPWGAHELRYWDGTDWTEHVSDAGVQSTAPLSTVPVVSPPAATPPAATAPAATPAAGWATPATPQKKPAATVAPAIGWIVLGGAVLAALGSFLPWAEASGFGQTETASGFDGDGVITIVMAVIVGVLAFPLATGTMTRGRTYAALAVSVLIAVICVIDIVDVSRVADDFGGAIEVSVSYGLWMTLVGGLVATGGSIAAIVQATSGRN